MFESAQLAHVHALHYYGRQLNALKRIYKSYCLIIERVLQGPQSLVAPSDTKDAVDAGKNGVDEIDATRAPAHKNQYGVSMAHYAVVRFERLKDRINLYALSEIQACLDEKESLMTLVCDTEPLLVLGNPVDMRI